MAHNPSSSPTCTSNFGRVPCILRLHLLPHRTIGRSVWQTVRLIVSAHMMFTCNIHHYHDVNISTFIVRFWRINLFNSHHSPRAQLLFSRPTWSLHLCSYRTIGDCRTWPPEVRSDSPIAADSPIVRCGNKCDPAFWYQIFLVPETWTE